MTRHPMINLLLLACALATFAACATTAEQQRRARADVQSELEQRQADQQEARERYQRGVQAYQEGELDEAYRHLRRSVAIDADHAPAALAFGVAAHDSGKLYEAATAFSDAAKLAPGRYEPHYNLGRVHETAGQHEKAMAAYQRALELAPDRLEVKQNLARAYIATGENLDHARRLISEALQREQRPEWRQWLRQQAQALDDQELNATDADDDS